MASEQGGLEKQTVHISGNYIAEMSGDPEYIRQILHNSENDGDVLVKLAQKDDLLTLSFHEIDRIIYGDIDGHKIALDWGTGNRGRLTVKEDGKELRGVLFSVGTTNQLGNVNLILRKLE